MTEKGGGLREEATAFLTDFRLSARGYFAPCVPTLASHYELTLSSSMRDARPDASVFSDAHALAVCSAVAEFC